MSIPTLQLIFCLFIYLFFLQNSRRYWHGILQTTKVKFQVHLAFFFLNIFFKYEDDQ